MRYDNLGRALDERRWSALGLAVAPVAAVDLKRRSDPPVDGAAVAKAFGLLATYVTTSALLQAQSKGLFGTSPDPKDPGAPWGLWLTPTPYAACIAPYNLGLNSPRDWCVLVDVTGLSPMWGPGTCVYSMRYPATWRGGGIEFYLEAQVPWSDNKYVKDVLPVRPCGDPHR